MLECGRRTRSAAIRPAACTARASADATAGRARERGGQYPALKPLLVTLALLLGCLGLLLVLSAYRWRRETTRLVKQLRLRGPATRPTTFNTAELRGLPPPVVRYFGTVLSDAHPVIRYARLVQRGRFLVRPTPNGWRPFTAEEHFGTESGGFVWSARIAMAPRLSIWVRDGLVGGTGSMRAGVMGLWTVADVKHTPEIAEAALQRYLAEAVWFPTALLPSQGVAWAAMGDTSARATLTVAGSTASLDFHFGGDGLVKRVYTAARGREVEGRAVPTPWQGRFSRYESRDGVTIPIAGEVEWLLPEGARPYWRGELTAVSFEY